MPANSAPMIDLYRPMAVSTSERWLEPLESCHFIRPSLLIAAIWWSLWSEGRSSIGSAALTRGGMTMATAAL